MLILMLIFVFLFFYMLFVNHIEYSFRSNIVKLIMHKTKCKKCGNIETEILRRGKFSEDVLFCPFCDDICNKI
jgi:hypothetical protein